MESRWSPLTTPHLPTRLDRRSVALGAAGSRRGKVTIYFVVFDVLAYGADDLRAVPYQLRRARLEQLFVAAAPPLKLAPSTTDRVAAMAWMPPEVSAVGIEGIVASSSTPYRPGRTGPWVKIRQTTVVDALMVGVTGSPEQPVEVVLACRDETGELRRTVTAVGAVVARVP
ncbi:hypothetical protein AB0K15_28970 [Amycolatopsis sp. NPDC049253]|uniref:ATP-dependent DNA ligase n=1 Tax=Amycolatopsis sp. NPDC049253 TaxID=3155274 RepID=UPI003433328E